MSFFSEFLSQCRQMTPFARAAIRLGTGIAFCYIILAVAMYLSAGRIGDLHRTLLLMRTAREAAPASFIAGLGAGLLCDIIQRHDGRTS